ncbi:RNA polymerase I transcription factor UAF [Phaffia rhodozyma]|uniref:RNA polymerase I transcription factor UAF n=1 Tax=Phaffia rhodozyma TaxID=264483 RepID=A0A0F7SR52_PHARH|nr:RNA polymerase I transcription factor UAF [Phaffia rhodozyma]
MSISSFDPQSLIPRVRSILEGADLSTVSARQVRKQLSEQDPSLTPDLLKSHKDAIDDIVMTIFDALAAPPSESSDDNDDDDDAPESPPRTKKQPSSTSDSSVKSKAEPLSDAQLAQQLSDQINGAPNARSTRASSSSTSKTAKGKGKAKASASKTSKTNASGSSRSKKNTVLSQATIGSSDDEDHPDGTKKAKRKRSTDSDNAPEAKPKKPKKPKKEPKSEGEADGEPKKGGVFMKPWGMSAPLSALLGGQSQLPRPQVVKQIWAYVKENNIQDPANKSFFLCDDRMQAVFKTPRLHMFTMNKLLSDHLYPVKEAQS